MNALAVTDIGRSRPVNQDVVFSSLEPIGCLPNLFIVADGMGGHKAGDTASRFTVDNFVDLIRQSDEKDPVSVINESVSKVNEKLLIKASESPDYDGMGTTLVAAVICDGLLKVANVGDSRLYVINDEITQITRDHSWVEEMVMRGEINRQEARHHEKKNVITRAIGGEHNVEAEMFSVDLNKDDKILMCSDGLTNMIEDADILRIVKKSPNIKEAARELIEQANNNGGRDNISVIIIEP